MKLKLVLIVISALACALIGCNSAPQIPEATPEVAAKRLEVARKVVAAVETAPPAERAQIARSFGEEVAAVRACGDADLLARWEKAFQELNSK